jgi:hypothetical protein
MAIPMFGVAIGNASSVKDCVKWLVFALCAALPYPRALIDAGRAPTPKGERFGWHTVFALGAASN